LSDLAKRMRTVARHAPSPPASSRRLPSLPRGAAPEGYGVGRHCAAPPPKNAPPRRQARRGNTREKRRTPGKADKQRPKNTDCGGYPSGQRGAQQEKTLKKDRKAQEKQRRRDKPAPITDEQAERRAGASPGESEQTIAAGNGCFYLGASSLRCFLASMLPRFDASSLRCLGYGLIVLNYGGSNRVPP
jgi:hypothetical protein